MKFNIKGRGEVLGGIVTVVILAVVVFVAGSLSPTGKLPRSKTQDKSAISRQFVLRAQDALNSGDSTLAAQLASKALEADSANAAAKSVQAKAKAAKSSEAGASSGDKANAGETNASPEVVTPKWATKPGADLKKLIPTELGGYDMSEALIDEGVAQTSGDNVDPAGQVVQIIWTVREMKSAKDASDFIDRTSRGVYGKDAQTVSVDGAQAYFGTDSVRYATCAYTRGVYVFEVLGATNTVRPSAIKREVIAAAKAFPDNP